MKTKENNIIPYKDSQPKNLEMKIKYEINIDIMKTIDLINIKFLKSSVADKIKNLQYTYPCMRSIKGDPCAFYVVLVSLILEDMIIYNQYTELIQSINEAFKDMMHNYLRNDNQKSFYQDCRLKINEQMKDFMRNSGDIINNKMSYMYKILITDSKFCKGMILYLQYKIKEYTNEFNNQLTPSFKSLISSINENYFHIINDQLFPIALDYFSKIFSYRIIFKVINDYEIPPDKIFFTYNQKYKKQWIIAYFPSDKVKSFCILYDKDQLSILDSYTQSNIINKSLNNTYDYPKNSKSNIQFADDIPKNTTLKTSDYYNEFIRGGEMRRTTPAKEYIDSAALQNYENKLKLNMKNEDPKQKIGDLDERKCDMCEGQFLNELVFSNKNCNHSYCIYCINDNVHFADLNKSRCPMENCTNDWIHSKLLIKFKQRCDEIFRTEDNKKNVKNEKEKEKDNNTTVNTSLSESMNKKNKSNGGINIEKRAMNDEDMRKEMAVSPDKTKEELITCSICTKKIKRPMIFTNKCRHSYCFVCIQQTKDRRYSCLTKTCCVLIDPNSLANFMNKVIYSESLNQDIIEIPCKYCSHLNTITKPKSSVIEYLKCTKCSKLLCCIHNDLMEKCICLCPQCVSTMINKHFLKEKYCSKCKIKYCELCKKLSHNQKIPCSCKCDICYQYKDNQMNKSCSSCLTNMNMCQYCYDQIPTLNIVKLDCSHSICKRCIFDIMKSMTSKIKDLHSNNNVQICPVCQNSAY